jgi:putative ABC transport system substrate-binding protein
MLRRDFVKVIAGSTVAIPLAVPAQQTQPARIGWMSRGNPTANDPAMNAFRQGMRELGYVEGRSFVIEPRYAEGKSELMPKQAAELERAGVDVVIAGPFDALQAAKQSTSRVPIVMTPSVDPVAMGIVESLERPGGNITGITEMMPDLTAERVKLLKQIMPTLKRVAILWRPGTLRQETFGHMLADTQAAARLLDLQIQIVEASRVDDFDVAFSAMAKDGAEGLVVLVNQMFFLQRKQIIERAAKYRFLDMYEWRGFVESGGLISYGADVLDVYRRAAGVVDKILKGTKPADLPVEDAKSFNLAVNLKTAKALGVTIPDSILKQAVDVIE